MIEGRGRSLIGAKNRPFQITVSNGLHQHTLEGTAKA
jgi:hypothetical protein